jgi:hypothetical protein
MLGEHTECTLNRSGSFIACCNLTLKEEERQGKKAATKEMRTMVPSMALYHQQLDLALLSDISLVEIHWTLHLCTAYLTLMSLLAFGSQ